MSMRKPARAEYRLLRLWHAWILGAYVVAYLTADEDTYALHLFSGYAVLAAIAARVLAGLIMPAGSPFDLPRPHWRIVTAWLHQRKGRHPLFSWFAAALLVGVGLAAASGVMADGLTWMEDPHEALAEFTLWLIAAHVAFVAIIHGGGRRLTAFLNHLLQKETFR